MKEHFHELSAAAVKASPPVTVGASIMAGVQLADVVLIATLIYTLLQIYVIVKNIWRDKHGTRPETSPREASRDSDQSVD